MGVAFEDEAGGWGGAEGGGDVVDDLWKGQHGWWGRGNKHGRKSGLDEHQQSRRRSLGFRWRGRQCRTSVMSKRVLDLWLCISDIPRCRLSSCHGYTGSLL